MLIIFQSVVQIRFSIQKVIRVYYYSVYLYFSIYDIQSPAQAFIYIFSFLQNMSAFLREPTPIGSHICRDNYLSKINNIGLFEWKNLLKS